MAIKTLQARLTPLGRIRLGVYAAPPGKKARPEKLETFRFTSPSEQDVKLIAHLYGGDPRPWKHRTTGRPEFEVITEATEVPVFVPPQEIDPYMELWGNGFCTRRCDGEREIISDSACLCDAENNRQCKPTTRLSVVLAEIEGIGGWRVESHGWNAAAELSMVARALAQAPAPVPAELVVDWRQEKKIVNGEVKTFQYAVPMLRFRGFTPQQAFAGQLESAGWAAVGGADRLAIEAGDPDSDPAPLLAAIAKADTRAEILSLRQAADAAGLSEQWTARARAIHAAEQTPAGPVDAVVVEDSAAVKAEADALWQQIVAAAGARGWNTAQLTALANHWLLEHHNVDQWEARPEHFAAFAAAIEAGEVQP